MKQSSKRKNDAVLLCNDPIDNTELPMDNKTMRLLQVEPLEPRLLGKYSILSVRSVDFPAVSPLFAHVLRSALWFASLHSLPKSRRSETYALERLYVTAFIGVCVCVC